MLSFVYTKVNIVRVHSYLPTVPSKTQRLYLQALVHLLEFLNKNMKTTTTAHSCRHCLKHASMSKCDRSCKRMEQSPNVWKVAQTAHIRHCPGTFFPSYLLALCIECKKGSHCKGCFELHINCVGEILMTRQRDKRCAFLLCMSTRRDSCEMFTYERKVSYFVVYKTVRVLRDMIQDHAAVMEF